MSLADQASLLLIPTGYKSQKVYSIFPTDGDGDFDFSRSSSATRIAKNGLITTVAANVPRLNYPLIDGVVNGCPSLLLESQRTNLITYSEDFSNAIWTNSGAATIVNPTANLSPDGTLSGNEFNEGSADSRRGVYEDVTVSANTSYTLSVFVKKGTSDYLRLVIANGLNSGSDWTAIQVDLSNNSISTKNGDSSLFTDISNSISDTDYNGYYRLTLTAKHPTTTTLRVLFGMSDGVAISGSNSIARRDYVGTNKYLYVWGAQLEEGSYATSYIPTNGASVTRLAETANGAGNSDTFNDSEGVLMAEISALANSGNGQIRINEQGVLNSVIMEFRDSGTTLRTYIFDGNATNQFLSETNINPNDNIKIALKYKQNDCSLYLNGFVRATDTTATMPSNLNSLSFDQGDGNNHFYGNTKQIQYHNSALTDSELEQLTSWTSFTDMANGQLYTIE